MNIKPFRGRPGFRTRILILAAFCGLVPLAVVSAVYFLYSRDLVLQARTEIYLRHISRQNADKLELLILERKEECAQLATSAQLTEILRKDDALEPPESQRFLDEYVQIQQVYDLVAVVDRQGKIRAMNSMGRFGDWLDPTNRKQAMRDGLKAYPEELWAWHRACEGSPAVQDWYRSAFVRKLYDYSKDDESRRAGLLFAFPIRERFGQPPLGVLLCWMNWEYVQAVIDLVEQDFSRYGLHSGFAFIVEEDSGKVIASPFRANRTRRGAEIQNPVSLPLGFEVPRSWTRGLSTSQSVRLQWAQERQAGVCAVDPQGLGWAVVVCLSESDVLQPVNRMALIFAAIFAIVAILTVGAAALLGRSLVRPLLVLRDAALEISRGEHQKRVRLEGRDEVFELAGAFNVMADAVEERQLLLQHANEELEEKVRLRTEALEKKNQELLSALRELEGAQDKIIQAEKMASLGRLVAGIAHEIKNPLNFIFGNTQFLVEYTGRVLAFAEELEKRYGALESDLHEEYGVGFIQEDMARIVEEVNQGAERIRAIVEDLRTFSRAPSGAISHVDLGKILDMCLNLLRNQYKGRVRIHRDYAPVPALLVYLGKVEQVFLNLFANAIQAIPGEGDIWVRLRSEEGWVVTEIQDSGPGIPSELLDKIFDPFFTTKDVGQGTGLGLSISYGIVQQHGGRISVRNAPESGAIFRVALPIRSENAVSERKSEENTE